jgi:protein O-GlcNAc transferase
VKLTSGSFDLERAMDAGLKLHQSGRIDEAEQTYQRVLTSKPSHWGALHLLGLCRYQRGDLAAASALIRKAIELNPADAVLRNNLGAVLLSGKAAEEALSSFDRALELNPGYAEAWNNRGNALSDLRLPQEALGSYARASQLGWRQPLLTYNEANALHALGRYEEARSKYEIVLGELPGYQDCWHNLGMVQERLGRMEDAARSYLRALSAGGGLAHTLGNLMFVRLRCCDWTDFDALVSAVLNGIDSGHPVSEPFKVLAIETSPSQQQACSRMYAEMQLPETCALDAAPAVRRERLRVGYFSSDFHDHATAHLIAEVFERHDRSRIEAIGFSFGPKCEDLWRRRLERGLAEFHDVRELSDRAIAELARELEIDIAVDLKGYTGDARPGIFAHRAAPVQVNYLGYPGTLGTHHYDYLVADPVVVPATDLSLYSEKVAFMPDSYQPNDSTKVIAARTPSREEAGLPVSAFVFCSFNNSYKITPDVFSTWMSLLRTVENSVLWLLDCGPIAVANLRREARNAGVEAERLIFASRLPLADHLARHRVADLFLDTFHCNAHTTASDALWAGLPLLTRIGSTFAGRVAASLLHAIGMDELIAPTTEAYRAMAVTLACEPDRLLVLRERLASNRLDSALFDCGRYTRNLESLYSRMWERHLTGLPPAHLRLD